MNASSWLVGANSLGAAQTTVVADLGHVAPMLIVALWSLLLLVADTFAGAGLRVFQRRIALVGVGAAIVVAGYQMQQPAYDAGVRVFADFLVVDQYALFLDVVLLGIAALVLGFAGEYARHRRFEYGEQEALILIATFGAMMLVHAEDLLALFLGLETMSITSYVLVGARWNSKASPEAAMKYFLMGAFSSGLLLMGIALLYGATGATQLGALGTGITRAFHEWRAAQVHVDIVMHPEMVPISALRDSTEQALLAIGPAALLIPGILLVLTGLLFKISAVPFHMWTPDVYEGAPTPVSAFLAAAVKTGGIAALLRLFLDVFGVQVLVVSPYGWTPIVALVAFLTMTLGNFAAFGQTRIKRLLAFSSVAHVGYVLVGVVAAGNFYGRAVALSSGLARGQEEAVWAMEAADSALAAILYYVAIYAIATVGCFAAIAYRSAPDEDMQEIHDWSGMAERHPQLALGMALCLLSLLGMPPLAGFFGKVSLFRAALANDNEVLRWLVVAALLNSVVGAYYYLRIIVAMYFRDPPRRDLPVMPGRGALVVLALAAVASLAAGLGAGPVLDRCRLGAAGFVLSVGGEARQAWVQRTRTRLEGQEAAPAAEAAAAKAADGAGANGDAMGRAVAPADGAGANGEAPGRAVAPADDAETNGGAPGRAAAPADRDPPALEAP